jgi:hypothetical protein
MIATRTIYDKAFDFSFLTVYKGRQLTLTISPFNDRFTVLADGKLFGHIKIGYDRHAWYVADGNFVEYELVKEIGQVIIAKFY